MLTDTEIRHLLAAVVAYDNRDPGQAMRAAWTEVARRAAWTFDEALEAVHAHYAARTDWLMPGHITEIIRTARRGTVEREHSRSVLDAARATARQHALTAGGTWPIGDDPDWGRHNLPQLEAIHAQCAPHLCDNCGAPVGERCRNRVTGNATKIPCLARLKAARIGTDA